MPYHGRPNFSPSSPFYSKVCIRYLEGKICFLLTVLRINKLSQDLFHVVKKNLWPTNPIILHSCRAMTNIIIFKSGLAYLVALTYNSWLSEFGSVLGFAYYLWYYTWTLYTNVCEWHVISRYLLLITHDIIMYYVTTQWVLSLAGVLYDCCFLFQDMLAEFPLIVIASLCFCVCMRVVSCTSYLVSFFYSLYLLVIKGWTI